MRLNAINHKAKPVRIADKSRTVRRIEPAIVAQALGAVPADAVEVSTQGPASLLALRQEILRRLVSSGGRPGLAGTNRRQKIPLDDSDWRELERIAATLRAHDIRATAGQVASILLHRALLGVSSAKT